MIHLSLFQNGQAFSRLRHGKPPFFLDYNLKRRGLDLQYSCGGYAEQESRARLQTHCSANRLWDYNSSRCIDGRFHGNNLTKINSIFKPILQSVRLLLPS